MKLSEIRPCDNCGGKIAPLFYVLRISQAMFMPSTNEVLGLTQCFRGALALAEAMAPEPEVVMVLGDEDKALQTELFICQECLTMKALDLAALMERRGVDAT